MGDSRWERGKNAEKLKLGKQKLRKRSEVRGQWSVVKGQKSGLTVLFKHDTLPQSIYPFRRPEEKSELATR
jgi:hypothetical protein